MRDDSFNAHYEPMRVTLPNGPYRQRCSEGWTPANTARASTGSGPTGGIPTAMCSGPELSSGVALLSRYDTYQLRHAVQVLGCG